MYPLYNYNTKPDDYQQCFSNTTADGYREDIRGESHNSGEDGSGSAVNSVIINRDADGVESGETVNHEREIAAVIELSMMEILRRLTMLLILRKKSTGIRKHLFHDCVWL